MHNSGELYHIREKPAKAYPWPIRSAERSHLLIMSPRRGAGKRETSHQTEEDKERLVPE